MIRKKDLLDKINKQDKLLDDFSLQISALNWCLDNPKRASVDTRIEFLQGPTYLNNALENISKIDDPNHILKDTGMRQFLRLKYFDKFSQQLKTRDIVCYRGQIFESGCTFDYNSGEIDIIFRATNYDNPNSLIYKVSFNIYNTESRLNPKVYIYDMTLEDTQWILLPLVSRTSAQDTYINL